MQELRDTLFYALRGMEALTLLQYNYTPNWSCKNVVNTSIEIVQLMLADEEIDEHKNAYLALINKRMYGDTRDTMITIIVMAVILGLIQNSSQAIRCRNIITENMSDEMEELYRTYQSAVDQQIDIEMNNTPTKTYTITIMENKQPIHIGYNVEHMTINMSGGTLVQHADLVQATGQVQVATTEQVTNDQPAESTFSMPIPTKGKYTEVRKYIEERKRFDEEFLNFCKNNSLRALCDRLSKEFGWFVDEKSLGRNINRNL